MQLSPLTAVSPIDGRYHKGTQMLSTWFSEYALIKYRLHVEVEYFIALAGKRFFKLDLKLKNKLRALVHQFSEADAAEIKKTEAITNHDVKAVEYFLKQKLEDLGGAALKEWVHFGLTSQDVNHTAVPLSWKDCIANGYLPALLNLKQQLLQRATEWKAYLCLLVHTGSRLHPQGLAKSCGYLWSA